ncbi:DUF2690 domain-containing protein, partial [Kitasatospora sp. NPDC094028]
FSHVIILTVRLPPTATGQHAATGRTLPDAALATVIPATTASATTVSATVRPAVSCSGYSCDGWEPDQSGCANDAVTPSGESVAIMSGNATVGWIELRYSPTCRTAWARVRSYYWGGQGEFAAITRHSDNQSYGCASYNWSTTLGAYSCYTQMVYDGGEYSQAFGKAPNWYNGALTSARTPWY